MQKRPQSRKPSQKKALKNLARKWSKNHFKFFEKKTQDNKTQKKINPKRFAKNT